MFRAIPGELVTAPLSTPRRTAAGRYAGARVDRVEDPRLLTGTGTFVDDVSRPGMLHACFVRSPFARARINAIRTSEALAVPGVHRVFLASDLNADVREQWHTSIGPHVPEVPRPPLAEDEVRFVGDPVALVIAESRYVAEDAAELVDVDYEPLPAVVDYVAAVGGDVSVHEATPGNIVGEMAGPRGDRGRRGVRVRGARRERDVPSARLRPGADGDARARRRVVRREWRDDDLGIDAGATRGASLLLPSPRRVPSTASGS